jgi:hypothetical protein
MRPGEMYGLHSHWVDWLRGRLTIVDVMTCQGLVTQLLVPLAICCGNPGDSLDSHLGGACTLSLPGRIGPATRESA